MVRFSFSKRDTVFVAIISLVILLDQFTKYLIRKYITTELLITDFFSFTFITNTGASFGMFRGMNNILIVIGLIITFILVYYLHTSDEKSTESHIFFGLIVGGALSNIIDRIVYGHVIDFISVSFWPSFNLADSAITLGVLGLILYHYKKN